ncbi:hypothetical protein [Brachybacterium muris]|uniref:hypothetical protein n=1 Tax=Brachybacterium muris TaxID=219301 RepID=UPI00223ABBCC|nr:hypothetical protein [Brachybacterium muris]MCT1653329.1 hypothetical protein [Brachybacterium muris]MCT2295314.1 hypothetical protein [Brachybacterium muris]
MTAAADSPAPTSDPADPRTDQQEPAGGANPTAPVATDSGVRVVTGRLETEELAAIAVVVSAMSVTSRLEAEERLLTEGHSAGAGVWNDPVHCHPHTFEARNHCSEAAWRYSHR